MPFPLAEENCRLFEFARHGLWHGLTSIGVRAGDEVLVPAYHHGSEVEVLERYGATCRFFETTDDLAPDELELEAALGCRTRALYLIHHLGFPQDSVRWRSWCDEHGLLLIEDAAMAWPATLDGRPLGSWGDLAIYSPWKTYGLPDLGALICDAAPSPVSQRRLPRLKRMLRSHAEWLAGRSARLAGAYRRVARKKPLAPDRFGLADPSSAASSWSLFLLRRLCRIDASSARQANYTRMLEVLGGHVPEPFDRLPDGACPFVFPVSTDDKLGLLDRLARHGIIAVDLWSIPHPLLPVDRFPRAAARRASTVGLPVHQELLAADVERILAVAGDFLEPAARRTGTSAPVAA